MYIELVLAILNVILCAWRFIATLRAGRLISTAWFLILYFAIFFIPVSLETEINWIRGFYAQPEKAGQDVIHKVIWFVLIFNLIFALTEMLLWHLVPKPRQRFNWQLPRNSARLRNLTAVLFVCWGISIIWYYFNTLRLGYRDYVEGADWATVFLWAASPLITVLAMQKRRLLAVLVCLPYLYFAIHLAVRSFALFSLIPLLVVGFYQVAFDPNSRAKLRRLLIYGAVGGVLLTGVSIFISQYKNGEVAFPDSKMPYGVVEAVAMVDKFETQVGFNSLILYSSKYVGPFYRLFSIKLPEQELDDTPVIIARLLDGVPIDWPVYFHYPALLWTDAYIAFGWGGLCLAIFWACVLCLWDGVMMRFPMLLALLIPYFVWHNYMLVRGAISVAAVPLAYALYFSFFAFVGTLRGMLIARVKGAAPRKKTPLAANLMPKPGT